MCELTKHIVPRIAIVILPDPRIPIDLNHPIHACTTMYVGWVKLIMFRNELNVTIQCKY